MTFLGVCPRFVVLQVSVSKGRYTGRLYVELDLSAYSFEMGFAGVMKISFFGVVKQCECKCMVTSRHFPYNSALFGLAI